MLSSRLQCTKPKAMSREARTLSSILCLPSALHMQHITTPLNFGVLAYQRRSSGAATGVSQSFSQLDRDIAPEQGWFKCVSVMSQCECAVLFWIQQIEGQLPRIAGITWLPARTPRSVGSSSASATASIVDQACGVETLLPIKQIAEFKLADSKQRHHLASLCCTQSSHNQPCTDTLLPA